MTKQKWAVTRRLAASALLVIALVVAAVAQLLVDIADVDPVVLLPGVVLIYSGLLSAWHDAVGRVSGRPNVWFTVLVPILTAVQAIGVETANGVGFELDTSAVSLALVLVAVIVTVLGAYRNGRRWTTGLLAWSLLLLHLAIVIGGLAGIPLSTFGDATRTDEFMLYAAPLPFLAMVVAVIFAPQTRPLVKVGIATLIVAAAPAWLATQTVLTGLVALGVAGVMITWIGTPTTSTTGAVLVRERAEPPRGPDGVGQG